MPEAFPAPDRPAPDRADSDHLLWYNRPAERWFEALPVGNGRSGGMVYSGAQVERIQLAETTAWSGGPATTDVSPTALDRLPEIRRLLFEGRNGEAQDLVNQHLLGRPTSFGTNLPLPELLIGFPGSGPVTDLRRSLDLRDAIVRASYRTGQVSWSREVFASHPDRVIVVRIESIARGACALTAWFGDALFPVRVSAHDQLLVLSGQATEEMHSDGREGVDLQVRVRLLLEGGTAIAGDARAGKAGAGKNRVEVTGADAVTFVIGIGTSWNGTDPAAEAAAVVDRAAALTYQELRARHVTDYREPFERVTLNLGPSDPAVRALPTDERRLAYAEGGPDPELESLYFQYGRYLTVAGSRDDSPLPLALQGLWNDGLASSASWTNDFHLDINTQQNYWAAELTNLAGVPRCRLFRPARAPRRDRAGHRPARCTALPGWVAHTVTNAWGYSAPGSGLGLGPERHRRRLDRPAPVGALRVHPRRRPSCATGPTRCSAARRSSSWPTWSPTRNEAGSSPGRPTPPRTGTVAPDGSRCSSSMGNTVDRVFVEATCSRSAQQAAAILGVDAELRGAHRGGPRAAAAVPGRPARPAAGMAPRLRGGGPSHRHTSHLCALFPERQITPRATPELARAAEVTIERRQAAPGLGADRVGRGELHRLLRPPAARATQALAHLTGLITDASEANLLTYSVGGVAGAAQNIYSFDGNAGGTAGIAEMLLQSDGGEIELLPALPGRVAGRDRHAGCAPEAASPSTSRWQDGRLLGALITADRDTRMDVRYGDGVAAERFLAAEPRRIEPQALTP